jgi:hypothetical protein
MANQLFNETLEITQHIWKEQFKVEPMRNIRMPDINKTAEPIDIDALWTDRGVLPDVGKLAFLIQFVAHERDLLRWKQRLAKWPFRGGLLVSPDEKLHLVEPPSDSSQALGYEVLSIDDWRETLVSSKPHLFTPKALSQFRQGQLSLADIEETIDIKVAALRAHISQMKDWDPESTIKDWAAERAKGKEMAYAEGFRVVTLVDDDSWEKI